PVGDELVRHLGEHAQSGAWADNNPDAREGRAAERHADRHAEHENQDDRRQSLETEGNARHSPSCARPYRAAGVSADPPSRIPARHFAAYATASRARPTTGAKRVGQLAIV